MALSSLALAGAGAVTNSIGAYYSAKSEKSSLRFQAQMAEINARNAELAAQQEIRSGQHQEQQSRLQTAAVKSAQRVALGANGVALNEGSAANILTTTDYIGEVDANTIAANAVRSAWGYRTQGVDYKNRAVMARASASAISPAMAAGSSLLGDAGSIASRWYSADQVGALDAGKARMSRAFGRNNQVGDFPSLNYG